MCLCNHTHTGRSCLPRSVIGTEDSCVSHPTRGCASMHVSQLCTCLNDNESKLNICQSIQRACTQVTKQLKVKVYQSTGVSSWIGFSWYKKCILTKYLTHTVVCVCQISQSLVLPVLTTHRIRLGRTQFTTDFVLCTCVWKHVRTRPIILLCLFLLNTFVFSFS